MSRVTFRAWAFLVGAWSSSRTATHGPVDDTGNGDLAGRVLVPVEQTIPEPARYTLFHHGRGLPLDHMLITGNLLAHYRGSQIHNEILHDKSVAYGTDRKYPESDHAPWSPPSNSTSPHGRQPPNST